MNHVNDKVVRWVTESEDDPEFTRSTKRQLEQDEYSDGELRVPSREGYPLTMYLGRAESETNDSTTADEEGTADEVVTSRRIHDDESRGERITWTEEDFDGPNMMYETLKERRSLKRKRENGTWRAKGNLKGEGHGTGSKTSKDTKRNSEKKPRDYGNDIEDCGMEYTVPDYLQNRRAHFDKRVIELKDAGLKLPPSYDEIDFSDDERLEDIQEKPDFSVMKPVGQYRDKQLPYSLGIIPAPIAQWLRDYQTQGVSFLHKLFVYQTGGILGDDMGESRLSASKIKLMALHRAWENCSGDCILGCCVRQDG